MDSRKILEFCLEQGLLLDKEILALFSGTDDEDSIKLIIQNIKNHTQQKVITKNTFDQNKEKINQVFLTLPKENQEKLESLKIKLGLSIEISKEVSTRGVDINSKVNLAEEENSVKVLSVPKVQNKKVEVGDFVKHFRRRFKDMANVLQDHSELDNLVSIGKISGSRQTISIIGIVSEKRVTKNKNILLDVEDLTGKMRVLITQKNSEVYEKAEEIALDSVVGFKGAGTREILFVSDIVFPDSFIPQRKKGFIDEYVLFIGDLHFGSKRFLRKGFLKFIDYLNGNLLNTPEVEKIKYLFIVGDVITGVGNYPNQEMDLEIKDLEEQFVGLAELLGKIRKDIKIIISPGNHDGVRVMEPQPVFDEKYAWPLYNLKNVVITGNPAYVNVGAKKGFSGFDVLTYHGFSFPFYANNISRLMLNKAMNTPTEIMKYLLVNRHLAPTHASSQYFPLEEDSLMIRKIPDIFVSAHTHKSGITYYNNILVVSTSCWEAMTPYQEKFGNVPDHCKVPMFNLKTREVKILDFEEDEGDN